jgi:hypothetical protein
MVTSFVIPSRVDHHRTAPSNLYLHVKERRTDFSFS